MFNGTFRRNYEGDYHCTRLLVKTMLRDHEYLRSIGAAAISDEDGKLYPTAAGMLMFGDEYNIVGHFPEYFLDYREELDPTTRWSDRLQSGSGECSGSGVPNIFNVGADEGWEEPVIEERFESDRTVLPLSFLKKVSEKSGEKDANAA